MTITGDSRQENPDAEPRAGTATEKVVSKGGSGGLGSYEKGQSLLTDAGEIAQFIPRVIRAIPGALRYPSEVLRQTGILILSSTAIILFMEGILAAEISLEAHYLLRQIGAGGYAGIFTAVSDYTVQPEMWGWVLLSKVGCGLVAEIGSMRISDEIDALEVMGIDSMAYLVATRVLAMAIITPFMYLLASGVMYMVNYFLNVIVFQSVSAGGFLSVHYSFLTWTDILLSLITASIIGMLIVVVGCYYGYMARGGPVGVGQSTAKSAIINLVIVSVIGVIGQQLFFGGFTRAPIAN